MSDSKFRVAVCQIKTRPTKEESLIQAESMVREAATGGASIVIFPEMFSCIYRHEYFSKMAEPLEGETYQALSRWAREYDVLLVGGSFPEKGNGKLYNTCCIFDRDGSLLDVYRKAHLFDVDLKGSVSFKESDSFAPGNDYCVVDTDFGKIGIAICFDIRFPEYIRGLARRGAEVIVFPSQFSVPTGKAHWELMNRARAVDNECWIIGSQAACDPEESFRCWGHSMVVSPYGELVSEADETEQILFADIDLNEVDRVRSELPTFKKLREDLYPVNDGFPADF